MLLTEIDSLYRETISSDTRFYDGSQDKNEFKQCIELLSARIGSLPQKEIWFLEIGAFKGLWALALKVVCAHHGKQPHYVTITWISNDPSNQDIFRTEEVYKAEDLTFHLIDADSRLDETLSRVVAIRPRYDFVLIDGDHAFESVLLDIGHYGSLADEYLLFHDINTRDCGVAKAIQQSGTLLNIRISYKPDLMGIGIRDCRIPAQPLKRRKIFGLF